MKHIPFYVINFDFNSDTFINYDVMPYFIKSYNTAKSSNNYPKTFDEFKEFVKDKSMYMYWARCEYEIIITDWPNQKVKKKIDIHHQIIMNIDIVTNILISNINNTNTNNIGV
jgi:hypothetical protein